MIRLRNHIKSQRGQALVEFVLVVPVLLLVLSGLFEFGRLFNESLILTAAAREGARVAAVGNDDNTVIEAVQQYTAVIDRGQLEIDIAPSTRMAGQPITVTVTNPVQLVTPLFGTLLSKDTFIVQGTATMRTE